ncbi:hypothetical protein P154DRAFT_441415 [Amniculicola lignicola CBS 123094]|uniref:Uncharacterized protein n=1 Tax=Amniculicola lignicola CBS 123094 TaxID=1392246 RepID=A0A6A5W629_9PLEO|nr:hypothetical protein P154DRAFT_441415 [Amniculicola lignicola CBS 123094]
MTDKVTKPRARKKREPKATATVTVTEKGLKEQVDGNVRGLAVGLEKQEDYKISVPLALIPKAKPPLSTKVNTTLFKECPPHRHSSQAEGDSAIAALKWEFKLPMLYQPSHADQYDNVFISHFVTLNSSIRSYNQELPWITHLPGLHYKAAKPALRLSIRAASMAFYAQVHKDPSILMDSYRWYTQSLNAQRLALARLSGNNLPDDEEILVPIILGLYEVYAGSTPASVFHHLTAATRILSMRGPKNCRLGVASILFKVIRVSDGHKALIFNQPSVLSCGEWMTIPFAGLPKNAHQYLADILLAIPACIALSGLKGSLGEAFSTPISYNIDLAAVQRRTWELLQEVDDWAKKFPHLTKTSNGPTIVDREMGIGISGAVPLTPDSTSLILPEAFVALTASTYYAIRLILNLLAHKISPRPLISPISPSNANEMRSQSSFELISIATECSRNVLDIAGFLESTHPVGFDFMRSVFPLVVVAVLGPQAHEQKIAQEMLRRWGESRGIGGLCGAWTHR